MQVILALILILSGCGFKKTDQALADKIAEIDTKTVTAQGATSNAVAAEPPAAGAVVTPIATPVLEESPPPIATPDVEAKAVAVEIVVPVVSVLIPSIQVEPEVAKPKAITVQTCAENLSEQQQHNKSSSLHLKTKVVFNDDLSRDFIINYTGNAGDILIKNFEDHMTFTGKEVGSETFDIKAPLNPKSQYGSFKPNPELEYTYTIRWNYGSEAVPLLYTEMPFGILGTIQPQSFFECKTEKL